MRVSLRRFWISWVRCHFLPYITHRLEDKSRYQTVYAKYDGSAAAPTAGLHFTKELLAAIREKGINIAEVTLHVGLGTFRPVKADVVEEHHMHSEYYSVNPETADLINTTRKNGGRIIAVGTTQLPHVGVCIYAGWSVACRRWLDGDLYLSGLPVPCGGCADYEFPSAEVYIDDVGIGARRTGSYYECLRRGGKGSVSVLLLWGCDVHPLEVPRNSILNTEVYMQARVLLRRVTACIFMFVCHTSIFSQGIFSC